MCSTLAWSNAGYDCIVASNASDGAAETTEPSEGWGWGWGWGWDDAADMTEPSLPVRTAGAGPRPKLASTCSLRLMFASRCSSYDDRSSSPCAVASASVSAAALAARAACTRTLRSLFNARSIAICWCRAARSSSLIRTGGESPRLHSKVTGRFTCSYSVTVPLLLLTFRRGPTNNSVPVRICLHVLRHHAGTAET